MRYPGGYHHDLTLLEIAENITHSKGYGARLRFLGPTEAVDQNADYCLQVPDKYKERAHGAMQRASAVVIGQGFLRRGKTEAGATIQKCHILRSVGYMTPSRGLSGAAWASESGVVIGFQNAAVDGWENEGMPWGPAATASEEEQASAMAAGGFGFQLAFVLPKEFVERATIL